MDRMGERIGRIKVKKTGELMSWFCLQWLGFFVVAATVLSFWFSKQMMLIIDWCFSCCWAVFALKSQRLFIFPFYTSGELHRKLGWSMARTADPNRTIDIPNHVTLYSIYKLVGAGQEGLISAWGKAGLWPAGGEQLYGVSLFFPVFCFSLFFLLLDYWYHFYSAYSSSS